MRKVIALSTVLGLGALGMACGDTPANNAPANKPVVANVPAVVVNAANVAANTAQVAANQAAGVANAMKPSSNMAPSNAMKPANTMMNANVKK